MDKMSHSNNRVSMYRVTCKTNVVILSHVTKKIMNKMYQKVFKTKQENELQANDSFKSLQKTMIKAIKHKCLKMKKPDDDRCLWKKNILMGEKCQPMQSPEAIFYDDKVNRLCEPPRSKS